MSKFATSRMILRECPSEDMVEALASNKGWRRVTGEAAKPEVAGRRAVTWNTGQNTVLRYQEDNVSPNCWITVESDRVESVSAVAQEAYEALSPWSLEDLAAQMDQASGPIQLGQAIIRLGIAAPYAYDQSVFERIAAGLVHRALEVRDMAIWSTTYSPWAQYRPLLSEIAEHDPVQKLRERAGHTLEAFDAAGVGEQ